MKSHFVSVHELKKPFKCKFNIYDYNCDMKKHLVSVHERNHTNVNIVNTDVLRRYTCKVMLKSFMRKRNYSNVKFVTTVGRKNLIWNDMLSQFMGKGTLLKSLCARVKEFGLVACEMPNNEAYQYLIEGVDDCTDLISFNMSSNGMGVP